jgi:hypothetical protein
MIYFLMDDSMFVSTSIWLSEADKEDTNMREAIPPQNNLTDTFRFIANGRYNECLKFSLGMETNTLGYTGLIPDICRVLYGVLL